MISTHCNTNKFWGFAETRACQPEEFSCRAAPGECVPLTWMCDDSPDCSDGSDEKACSKMILTTNICMMINMFRTLYILTTNTFFSTSEDFFPNEYKGKPYSTNNLLLDVRSSKI